MLAVIRQAPAYGYEIAQKLAAYGFGQIAEGTIYPLLLRLERYGAVRPELRPSALGPSRKYYALTEAGERALKSLSPATRRAEPGGGPPAWPTRRRRSSHDPHPNACSEKTTPLKTG